MNFLIFATIFCNLSVQSSFLSAIALKTITVCENYPLVIQCPVGQSINIISGFYGRSDTETCMIEYPGCVNCDTTCSFDITSQLINSFNMKNNFEIIISNDYAGTDPCGGTYKYSIISYTCIPTQTITVSPVIYAFNLFQ